MTHAAFGIMRNSPNNVWSQANFDCADAKKIPTAFWSDQDIYQQVGAANFIALR